MIIQHFLQAFVDATIKQVSTATDEFSANIHLGHGIPVVGFFQYISQLVATVIYSKFGRIQVNRAVVDVVLVKNFSN